MELNISRSEHLLRKTENPSVITRHYLREFTTLYQEIINVAL